MTLQMIGLILALAFFGLILSMVAVLTFEPTWWVERQRRNYQRKLEAAKAKYEDARKRGAYGWQYGFEGEAIYWQSCLDRLPAPQPQSTVEHRPAD